MIKYTFTFDHSHESRFRDILSRLAEEEYNIIEDIRTLNDDEVPAHQSTRYRDKRCVIEMDSQACLTFRLGMKNLKIRHERTEEELAEEKALHEKNTVKITVKVPGLKI